MNRIADLTYIIAISITFYAFQATDFGTVFSLVDFTRGSKVFFFGKQTNPLAIITLLFFIGAMGKSAQIGLHT